MNRVTDPTDIERGSVSSKWKERTGNELVVQVDRNNLHPQQLWASAKIRSMLMAEQFEKALGSPSKVEREHI